MVSRVSDIAVTGSAGYPASDGGYCFRRQGSRTVSKNG